MALAPRGVEVRLIPTRELGRLPRQDRLALFNAKKFLSFQLAKLLDTLQNPSRKTHQSLRYSNATMLAKGPYPTFDNVTAIFSATASTSPRVCKRKPLRARSLPRRSCAITRRRNLPQSFSRAAKSSSRKCAR